MKVACVLEALDGFYRVEQYNYPPPRELHVRNPIRLGGDYRIANSVIERTRLFHLHDSGPMVYYYREIPT